MRTSKTLSSVLSLAICLMAIPSCQRENMPANSVSGKIQVNANTADQVTKSSISADEELTRTFVLDEENGLVLQEFVSDNLSQPLMSGEANTKGDVATTGNIKDVYGIFGMDGFVDNYSEIPAGESGMPVLVNGDQYIKNGEVKYKDGSWNLTDGIKDPYPWLNDVDFTFWSYAPKDISNSYGETAGSRGIMTIPAFSVPSDAKDQKDILIAYNKHSYPTDGETVDVLFRHALADIYFDVESIQEGLTVKQIEISGVYSQGDCDVTGSLLKDSNVAAAFNWKNLSKNTVTFTMGEDVIRPDRKDTDKENYYNHFFMIPQALTSGAEISIKLSDGNTHTAKLATNATITTPTTWSAGKYYKYKLIYNDPVFDFRLENAEQENISYVNTTSAETKTVGVVSTKNGTTPISWVIKSYQIEESEPVDVQGTSFSDGGLTALIDNGKLKLTALGRIAANQGNHDYWVNTNPVRTDYLDWSPADWSGSRATASSPLDLSKFDFEKETTRGSMTTANCYIVRHAGTYKIPLVYGNGIENGVINAKAIAPNPSVTNYYPFNHFVNHLNQIIFFVNDPSNSEFIENFADCVPTGCAVIWQDEDEVIKDLTITGEVATNYNASNVRYLQFTVDPAKICQNNALICIYKDLNGNAKYDSGEAIWSWHIWTTNNPALLAGAIPATNHYGNVYSFFPICNLGYVDGINYLGRKYISITLEQDGTGNTIDMMVCQPVVITQSTGNFYQFGRKDPMCRKDTPAKGEFHKDGPSIVKAYDISDAIKHPDTFYTCNDFYAATGQYSWGWPYSNMWTGLKATFSVSYENDSEIYKTIYDPSPVGYKLPASKAFTGFTTTGTGTSTESEFNVSSYSNGYYFYTNSTKSNVIMFPASGYRHSQTGAITDAGARGSYWSAVSGNESSGYQLLFYNGDGKGISPDNFERRSNGQSVRPVKE